MPTFTPPTIEEGMEGGRGLWRYYHMDRGVSVIVTGGQVSAVRYPTQDQVEAADHFYGGGRSYAISSEEAAVLTDAGYGGYIT